MVDHPRNTGSTEAPLFQSGGADLISTADDYQRFGRMLLGKGGADGNAHVSAQVCANAPKQQNPLGFLDHDLSGDHRLTR